MSKVDLRVDWCSYEAAKYAVMHWHYSKTMPAGKLLKIGAWEDGEFIGCVIFGRGAIYHIGDPYGLEQTECCELVRVALRQHSTPTSRIVSIAIGMVKRQSPQLRLLVSYADSKEGHLGILYQATNWVYVGGTSAPWIRVREELRHPRSVNAQYGTWSLGWIQEHIDPESELVPMPPKYKYLYPLDRAMRRQIEPLAQPYPKRAGEAKTANAPGDQPGNRGFESHPPAPETVQPPQPPPTGDG